MASNGGAGLPIDGVGPVSILVGQTTFDGNQAQGVLITNPAASVDLGCDSCTSTGTTTFNKNNAAQASFADAVADFQDARGRAGPPSPSGA